ncbi:DUF6270 domain-containing protein [Terrilactibacillus laevilacticus]|uniref:DUF6270 domain-containing protein n=1 Tax=Terrilactibacillus laevilacticus TaxID=1380157 RepID=UPI00114619A3|nr:DUF6270 domain-containing protein [Terrilactibacillus laevilacticus]
MDNIGIAVMGSCVTRDVFNSIFIKGYKDYFDCVLTQNQTSVISLMSQPIKFEPIKINISDKYSFWNIKTEFTKEFLYLLKEKKPSYIILDFFGDIHFGVLQIEDDKFITNNRWKIMKTTYYKELQQKKTIEIVNETEIYFELWKESIDKFFKFIKSELPNTKVILHMTQNTDYSISNDLSIKKLSKSGKIKAENVDLLNKYWSKLNEYVVNSYDVKCIDMTKKMYFSYENHPWGEFYIHFTKNYYYDFINKLQEVILEDYKFINKDKEISVNLVDELDISAHNLAIELQMDNKLNSVFLP